MGSGQYIGSAALGQWQTEFGQTGITQAGAGFDMRDELMTGWLNSPSFVSQMTLASLYDIGYTVVPEPSSALLAALGLLALRRR